MSMQHQYGFDIMNFRTGGSKCKSFWGRGATEDECLKDALRQAKQYAEQLTDKDYERARMRNREMYAPSRSSYEHRVVGHTLWR